MSRRTERRKRQRKRWARAKQAEYRRWLLLSTKVEASMWRGAEWGRAIDMGVNFITDGPGGP